LLGSALSLGKDTLSVAHRVSIGGNISVSSPVSVERGNIAVEFRSRFGNNMNEWEIDGDVGSATTVLMSVLITALLE
jgi:hypothetical protein